MITKKNMVNKYIKKMLNNEQALVSGKLNYDCDKILQGHCFYLPKFFD